MGTIQVRRTEGLEDDFGGVTILAQENSRRLNRFSCISARVVDKSIRLYIERLVCLKIHPTMGAGLSQASHIRSIRNAQGHHRNFIYMSGASV